MGRLAAEVTMRLAVSTAGLLACWALGGCCSRGGCATEPATRAEAPPRYVAAYGGSMLAQPGHPRRTFDIDGEGGGMVAQGYEDGKPVPGYWFSDDVGKTWQPMPEPKPR